MKVVKIKNRISGATAHAVYCPNKKGNLQYFIEGKFWNDKKFDRYFEIVKND